MINQSKLCNPPHVQHNTDVIVISVYAQCKNCSKLLEIRKTVSLHEMKQFRLQGKELRSSKLEDAYQEFAQWFKCLE